MNQDLRNDPRYQNHESRPDLAGEHPKGDFYQFVAMVIFVLAIAADYFWIKIGPQINDHINFWVRFILGGAVAGFGGWLALYGVHLVFSEYTEEPRMITHYMFSKVRHPVYLGAMLVYVGILIFTLSPLGLLAFLGIFILYDWLASDEENRMKGLFGDRYEEYKQKTGRWIPSFWKRR
jgi:protein-S-isoprenylcysteine O-methyltransferase Ste14